MRAEGCDFVAKGPNMLTAVVKKILLNSAQKIFPTNNILIVKWQLARCMCLKNSKLGIFLNKAKFCIIINVILVKYT